MRILDMRRIVARRAATASAARYTGAGGTLDGEWFQSRFAAVIAQVEARDDIALALKRVVLIALRQQPRIGEPPVLPIRTMRRMAPVAGYSPAYISKLASAAGIRLGRFIDLTLALRVLQLVAAEGCTLNEAAQRMGMGDASAVSSFITRATGSRPSRLTETDLNRCFERISEILGE